MSETSAREERLLRSVGEERAAQPPKLLAAAERELARRSGGTRRQAVGRIRAAGALLIIVGLFVVAMAAGVYEAIVFIFGPQQVFSSDAVVYGTLGLLGPAVAGLGLAVILRVRWVLGWSRAIPFLRKADVEVAAYSPDTAELLRVMGRARGEYPPEATKVAEGHLRERLEVGRERLHKQVRSWGTLSIVLAVLALINGILMVLVMLALAAMQGLGPELGGAGGLDSAEMLSGTELASAWLGALANAGLGTVLLIGGLGLRAHGNWGRVVLLWTVWASMAATALVSAIALPGAFARSGVTADNVLSLASAVIFNAAWLVICWWVTVVLCRPEVKETCGVEVPLP